MIKAAHSLDKRLEISSERGPYYLKNRSTNNRIHFDKHTKDKLE